MTENAQAEHDCERVTFQIENEGLLRDPNQAQVDEVEADKKIADLEASTRGNLLVQASEVRARVQRSVARKTTEIPV